MHPRTKYRILLTIFCALPVASLSAQAYSTASRMIDLSGFSGMTAAQTGLSGGRNLSETSGIVIGLKAYRGFEFAIEGRATYAVNPGSVVGENESLGGIRVERHMGRVHPYVDFLLGQGDLNYQSGGFAAPHRYTYYETDSIVLSAGLGAEVRIAGNVYAMVDIQMQHWNTPVTASGSMFSVPVMVGLSYHLPCLKHGHPY